MVYLKQSTSVTLLIGPFVDSTDGDTAETALTIAQADVRLSKNGGNMAAKNESTSCTHDELGYYTCPLDATDTGTLGVLKLMVHASGALAVWVECMVVNANWYDTMFSTDQLDVNVTNIEGSDATDQINAACDTALTDYDAVVPADLPTNFGDLSITATTGRVDVAAVGGTAQTANDNGADINAILADTDELQTDDYPTSLAAISSAISTLTGYVDTEVASILSLLDDPRTEPGQGAPPINPDHVTKVDYLYKAWRNKKTQTSSAFTLFADDGSTADQAASVSDDGTTATIGEIGSGA